MSPAFDGAALAALVDTLWTRLEDAKTSLLEAQKMLRDAPDNGAAYSLGKQLEAIKSDVERALARYDATSAASGAVARGELLFDYRTRCSGCRSHTDCALLADEVTAYCRGCAAEKAA